MKNFFMALVLTAFIFNADIIIDAETPFLNSVKIDDISPVEYDDWQRTRVQRAFWGSGKGFNYVKK